MSKPTDGAKPPAADPNNSKIVPKADDEGAIQEEIGGPKGPEPTRYGDWEVGGRCSDF